MLAIYKELNPPFSGAVTEQLVRNPDPSGSELSRRPAVHDSRANKEVDVLRLHAVNGVDVIGHRLTVVRLRNTRRFTGSEFREFQQPRRLGVLAGVKGQISGKGDSASSAILAREGLFDLNSAD